MIRATLAMFALFGATAAGAEVRHGYFATGIGSHNCSFWLSSPALEKEGTAWVHGLWTGLNVENPKNSFVGNSIDIEGRLREVKKLCSAKPSMPLVDAALKVFSDMAGR